MKVERLVTLRTEKPKPGKKISIRFMSSEKNKISLTLRRLNLPTYQPTNQPINQPPKSTSRSSLVRSAISAHKVSWWAVTRKYNYKGNCAGANGFSVLAEGPSVIILSTCASCGGMPFRGEGVFWRDVWGLIPEWLGPVFWKSGLAWSREEGCGSCPPPPFLNYILAFALQVSKIASLPNLS